MLREGGRVDELTTTRCSRFLHATAAKLPALNGETFRYRENKAECRFLIGWPELSTKNFHEAPWPSLRRHISRYTTP